MCTLTPTRCTIGFARGLAAFHPCHAFLLHPVEGSRGECLCPVLEAEAVVTTHNLACLQIVSAVLCQRFQQNDIVYRAGDPAAGYYLVLEGSVWLEVR